MNFHSTPCCWARREPRVTSSCLAEINCRWIASPHGPGHGGLPCITQPLGVPRGISPGNVPRWWHFCQSHQARVGSVQRSLPSSTWGDLGGCFGLIKSFSFIKSFPVDTVSFSFRWSSKKEMILKERLQFSVKFHKTSPRNDSKSFSLPEGVLPIKIYCVVFTCGTCCSCCNHWTFSQASAHILLWSKSLSLIPFHCSQSWDKFINGWSHPA